MFSIEEKASYGLQIMEKIQEAYNKANPKILSDNKGKTKIFLPRYAYDFLEAYLGIFYKNKSGVKSLSGLDLIVGYENKIIIVHEDFAEFGTPDLISSINL